MKTCNLCSPYKEHHLPNSLLKKDNNSVNLLVLLCKILIKIDRNVWQNKIIYLPTDTYVWEEMTRNPDLFLLGIIMLSHVKCELSL